MAETALKLPSRAAAFTAAEFSAAERYSRYSAAVQESGLPLPTGVIDLAAFTANAYNMLDRAAGVPLRIASKSLRVPALIKAALALPGYAGVLAFTISEAAHLVRSGVTADAVVAYPVLDPVQLQELFSDPKLLQSITLMVDHPEQLNLLAAAREQALSIAADSPLLKHEVRLCLDIDCALKVGTTRIGALRSAIRNPADAVAAAERIKQLPGYKLVGLMGYEAQIAGVTDSSPAITVMKQLSNKDLAKRRSAIIAAVTAHTEMEFVNGGGTGSIESTKESGGITEIAVGSGFFGPKLFDGYKQFTPYPAAHFALQVTRNPAPQVVTVHGGGWIASGQTGKDRAPTPVWPAGLRLTNLEGAGEVQTPLECKGAVPPIGSLTWWRHTKAGELSEHLNEYLLVNTADAAAAAGQTVSTYRGEGKIFL